MSQKSLKNSTNDELNLGKTVFDTIKRTILLILFASGFLFVTTAVLAPQVVTPFLTSIGCDSANYLLYKRMYVRDNSNQNLYNVIQLAIENEYYKEQTELIDEMINREDFSVFAKTIDEKTKSMLGKRFSIYADSYESYLRRHLVSALYNTGKEIEAKMMAIDSVYGKADELYVYVKLVVDDEKLEETQKEAELTTLYTRYDLMRSLDIKMLELDESLSLSESDYDSIIILEQKVKLAEVKYLIGKYTKDKDLENLAMQNIELWNSQIKVLLENL